MSAAAEPHPEAQAILDRIEALGVLPLADHGPAMARQLFEQVGADAEGPTVGDVSDLTVPGYRDGPAVPVRVYTPDAAAPHPTLVAFHGGGYVLGNLDTYDVTCRHLTAETGMQVVSVDYRLAPEHPFPAGVSDAYAAVEWAAGASAAGAPDALEPDGNLAVLGDSAGGTFAAAVSLMARDLDGPAIDYQALVYPAVARGTDWESMQAFAEGYFLNRTDMEWFEESHLPDPIHAANPYANPLEATDHAGLPPATVVTAGFDPLRDQGVAYANELAAAGVDVTHRHYDDMIHGFFSMLEGDVALERGHEAVSAVAGDLRAALR
jgi:acetyl esterase